MVSGMGEWTMSPDDGRVSIAALKAAMPQIGDPLTRYLAERLVVRVEAIARAARAAIPFHALSRLPRDAAELEARTRRLRVLIDDSRRLTLSAREQLRESRQLLDSLRDGRPPAA